MPEQAEAAGPIDARGVDELVGDGGEPRQEHDRVEPDEVPNGDEHHRGEREARRRARGDDAARLEEPALRRNADPLEDAVGHAVGRVEHPAPHEADGHLRRHVGQEVDEAKQAAQP